MGHGKKAVTVKNPKGDTKGPGRQRTNGETTLYHVIIATTGARSGLVDTHVEYAGYLNTETVAMVNRDEAKQLQCCARHKSIWGQDRFSDTSHPTSHTLNFVIAQHLLIDTGCLHTNIVSMRIAALLRQGGGMMRENSASLTSGLCGVSPLNKRDLSSYIERRENNRMITITQL